MNGRTPLRKEGLLAALRAVGVGVKAPTAKRKGGKVGANSRKKDPLAAGLLTAIEVCEVRKHLTGKRSYHTVRQHKGKCWLARTEPSSGLDVSRS